MNQWLTKTSWDTTGRTSNIKQKENSSHKQANSLSIATIWVSITSSCWRRLSLCQKHSLLNWTRPSRIRNNSQISSRMHRQTNFSRRHNINITQIRNNSSRYKIWIRLLRKSKLKCSKMAKIIKCNNRSEWMVWPRLEMSQTTKWMWTMPRIRIKELYRMLSCWANSKSITKINKSSNFWWIRIFRPNFFRMRFSSSNLRMLS